MEEKRFTGVNFKDNYTLCILARAQENLQNQLIIQGRSLNDGKSKGVVSHLYNV